MTFRKSWFAYLDKACLVRSTRSYLSSTVKMSNRTNTKSFKCEKANAREVFRTQMG